MYYFFKIITDSPKYAQKETHRCGIPSNRINKHSIEYQEALQSKMQSYSLFLHTISGFTPQMLCYRCEPG